ncbi:MFS transporter [Kutzneria sp. NPDC051319]|uniref:MFS transporter n=1 Tax=Kutzneria sp. NPDC051319 TaxID=3155047 RepID=UPI00343FB80B
MSTSQTDALAVPTTEAATARWRAVGVVLIGAFMAILDTFIVLVAAPAIQADLHTDDAELQLVVVAYQLAYAVALITGARLGDRYGRKRLFMSGMALFTVSSVVCAIAPTTVTLIVARLVQGISAALMFPQVFAVIQVLLPPTQRHRAFSALGAVIGVSTILGQLVGGLLIAANLFGSGWRPVFWVNVPIGIATLLLAAKLVPESRLPQGRRLDLPGLAALTVAMVLLIVPVVQGRQLGWPLWTWLSLAVSVPAFAVFALVERRVEAPLVSLRLFRDRSFSVGILLVVVAYAGVNSFFLVLSLMLQDGLGQSALGAGLSYAPLAVAFFVTSLLAGKLTPRYGRRVLEAGSVIAGLGFVVTMALALTAGPSLTIGLLMPSLVVVGIGNGLLLPQLLNTVLSRVGPNEVGMASGVLSTGQQVGGAVGVAVIGVVFFSALGGPGGHVASYGYALGVAVGLNVLIAVVATVLLLALPKAA